MFKKHLTEIQQHDYTAAAVATTTTNTETTETTLPSFSSSSLTNKKMHQSDIKWKILEEEIFIENSELLRLTLLFQNKFLPAQFYIFRVLDYHELFGWSAGELIFVVVVVVVVVLCVFFFFFYFFVFFF